MQNQKRSTPARPQPNQCFSATREINFAKQPKQPKQTTTTIKRYRDLCRTNNIDMDLVNMQVVCAKIQA